MELDHGARPWNSTMKQLCINLPARLLVQPSPVCIFSEHPRRHPLAECSLILPFGKHIDRIIFQNSKRIKSSLCVFRSRSFISRLVAFENFKIKKDSSLSSALPPIPQTN